MKRNKSSNIFPIGYNKAKMIQLTNKADCCGCSACESICPKTAIKMQVDDKGFSYPFIDQLICINCGLCDKVCPIINHHTIVTDKFTQKIFGCSSKTDNDVKNSSSGGMFSVFSRFILSQNGVVYGAAWSDEMTVRHYRISDISELNKLRGSKYVQSDTRGIYQSIKQDLDDNQLVLFSGTPCQISALRLYLRKNYTNLYTIDVVCHAVPSPLIFKDYIRNIERRYKKRVININLRDKSDGWSRDFHTKVFFDDGSYKYDTMTTNLWTRLYFSFCIDRDSCHQCKFTNYQRSGDITIADFWFMEEHHPDKHKPTGVSLAIVSTDKGMALFKEISNDIEYFETKREYSSQPCLKAPTTPSPNRDQFWDDYHSNGFRYVANKYCLYRWDKMLRLKTSLFIKTKILKRWIQ